MLKIQCEIQIHFVHKYIYFMPGSLHTQISCVQLPTYVRWDLNQSTLYFVEFSNVHNLLNYSANIYHQVNLLGLGERGHWVFWWFRFVIVVWCCQFFKTCFNTSNTEKHAGEERSVI